MVRILTAVILFAGLNVLLSAQEVERKEHPCRVDLIEKARKEGLRSLKIWEAPLYYWQRRECRKAIKNEKALSTLNIKQTDEDFENSKAFRGFTSGCAYLTIALVLVSAVSMVL